MKNRSIYLILLSIVTITGCTLSATEVEQAISNMATPMEATPLIITITPHPTQPALNDQTPLEGSTQVTATVDQQQVLLSNCSVQHPDWPIYRVKPGETLVGIASQFGTSVTVLTEVNCLVDANRIYVGQLLHVPLTFVPPEPVEPPPSLPLIDMGPPPAHVCAVVPDGEQAYIRDTVSTGHPIAILVGTVHFVRYADNASYIVKLPLDGKEGMVFASEADLVGSSCSEQPGNGSGNNPNVPANLPVIRNGDVPPGDLCSVIKEPSPGTRYIYGGTSSAHAPIATMGDYLLFLSEINGGYLVVLPGWDMNGWIPADGVLLFGNSC